MIWIFAVTPPVANSGARICMMRRRVATQHGSLRRRTAKVARSIRSPIAAAAIALSYLVFHIALPFVQRAKRLISSWLAMIDEHRHATMC